MFMCVLFAYIHVYGAYTCLCVLYTMYTWVLYACVCLCPCLWLCVGVCGLCVCVGVNCVCVCELCVCVCVYYHYAHSHTMEHVYMPEYNFQVNFLISIFLKQGLSAMLHTLTSWPENVCAPFLGLTCLLTLGMLGLLVWPSISDCFR